MGRTARGFVVLCSLLLGLLSSTAVAAPGADDGLSQADRQRARVLFRSAEASMTAGRWGEARRIFDELLALKETAPVRYNRGICNGKLGEWVSAYEDYQRAMVLSLGLENADQTFINAESQKGLREATFHTMAVTIVARPVPSAKGASLLVDGAPLRAGNEPVREGDQLLWGPLRLARADHMVEVRVDGREPLRQQARTSGTYGEQDLAQVIQLAWPEPTTRPTVRAAPGPREGEPKPGAQPHSLPLLVGGAGIGVALASAGLWAAHFAEGRDAQGNYPYLALAIATGGAALGAGVLALALDAGSATETTSKTSLRPQKGRPENRFRSRVMLAPLGAGVGLVGSW